jgi:CMP-N-acetylneuraminic acid synthetase
MYPFHPTFGSLRRQDLPKLLVLNGAINIYRADVARTGELPPFPGFFEIDRIEGFDIDDAADLAIARRLAAAPTPDPADLVVEPSRVSS